MKISIFPDAVALPKNKNEKKLASKYTSNPYMPEIVSVDNEEELINIITTYAWSPSIFSGYRSQKEFISSDFMVLDIDSGMTIEQSEMVVKELGICTLCIPSTSHTELLHRFRLIFPLSETITDKVAFIDTMRYLTNYFPADPSCIVDTARFFFAGKLVDGYWFEGKLLEPIKINVPKVNKRTMIRSCPEVEVSTDIKDIVQFIYGDERKTVPEQVAYFINNAKSGLEGEWHNSANRFIFTLALQGVPYEKVETAFESLAPDKLDDHDLYLLERAYNDGLDKKEQML